ncbi:hypothetical protein AB833_29065 [Chromatiales bacterium (ex Bugula neritina AB1)]|nr:hypothetical protein AB833_29065 [Chromatiales bacterium (ex Bugula neritina AB1)]
MRAKVRKVFKDHYDTGEDSHYEAQADADALFNRVAQQHDAVTFQQKPIQRALRQAVEQALPTDAAPVDEFGVMDTGKRQDKFRRHYQLDVASEFGKDDKKNAAIIIDRIISSNYQKDRKISRRLGMMGIDNDVTGLIHLIGVLDRKGRSLALKAIAEM